MGDNRKNAAPALIAMMLATTALAGCANKFIPQIGRASCRERV